MSSLDMAYLRYNLINKKIPMEIKQYAFYSSTKKCLTFALNLSFRFNVSFFCFLGRADRSGLLWLSNCPRPKGIECTAALLPLQQIGNVKMIIYCQQVQFCLYSTAAIKGKLNGVSLLNLLLNKILSFTFHQEFIFFVKQQMKALLHF